MATPCLFRCSQSLSVIPKLFLQAYYFELLFSVCVPSKLHLTGISQTKKYTSVSNACIGVGKPDEGIN